MSNFKTLLQKYKAKQDFDDLVIINHIDIALDGAKPTAENIRKILKDFKAVEYYDRIHQIQEILYNKWDKDDKLEISVSSVRMNMYVKMYNEVCKVYDVTTSKGKCVSMRIVGIDTQDKKHELLIRSNETIEIPSKMLIYGDSTCCNLKINGHTESNFNQTVENMLERDKQCIGLNMLLKEDSYSHLIFFGGSNDIGHGILIDDVLNNIKLLLSKYNKIITIVCVLTPSLIPYKDLYKQLCLDNNFIFDDIILTFPPEYLEGIHFSDKGKHYLSNYLMKTYSL